MPVGLFQSYPIPIITRRNMHACMLIVSLRKCTVLLYNFTHIINACAFTIYDAHITPFHA